MDYQSGEFKIPHLKQGTYNFQGVQAVSTDTIIFNNELHMLSNATWYEPGVILEAGAVYTHVHLNISDMDLKKGSNLANSNNWISTDIDKLAQGMTRNFRPIVSLAAGKENLFAFYNDSHNQLISKKYSPISDPDHEPGWSNQTLLIIDGDGSDKKNDCINECRSVASCAFGDNLIFVAGITSIPNESIVIAVFDVNDIKEGHKTNTWQAKSFKRVDLSSGFNYFAEINGQMQPTDAKDSLKDFGDQISMDWFSYVGEKDQPPQFALALNMNPIGKTFLSKKELQHSYNVIVPLHTTADPHNTTIANGPYDAINVIGEPEDMVTGSIGLSLGRDPVGRLRGYYKLQDKENYDSVKIDSYYFDTTNPIEDKLEFTYDKTTVTSYPTSKMDIARPSGTFYVDLNGKTTETKTVKTINDGTKSVPVNCYPVVEFTVYGGNRCQMNYYGKISVLEDFQDINKNDVAIISGIMDMPIPFPFENFKDVNLESPEKVIGEFAYGSKKGHTKETSKVSSWTAGFKSSGKTTKGIGPAWDIAVNGGMGSTTKFENESELSTEFSIETKVKSGEGSEPNEIEAFGGAQQAMSSFKIEAYQFEDAQGKIINNCLSDDPGVSTKNANYQVLMKAGGNIPFGSFAVTPGDLNSYTKEAINSRMQSLNSQPTSNPQLKGVTFYTGANYFEDIIIPNSYNFGTAQDPQHFLEFGWSISGETNQGFESMKSSFRETAWTFDAEIYAGVSGGGGIDFFGMGEEFESEFLAGGSYSQDHSNSTTDQSEWGLELNDFSVLSSQESNKDGIREFTFRAYFLPIPKSDSKLPSNYWTYELIKNGTFDDQSIDPNSSCWRLVFVVTKIVSNGNPDLNYPR